MRPHDTFCALDTETTGFGSTARVLEVAVVTFEGGKVVNEWSRLLEPPDVDWEHPKVKEALAVNHIEREKLAGCPTFAQVMPDLLVELSVEVWAAHNADFDMQMLNQELARVNQQALQPNLLLCTLNLSRWIHPQEKKHRLLDTAQRYSIVPEDAHRAAVDARTCGYILLAMLQSGRLPQEDAAIRGLRGWR